MSQWDALPRRGIQYPKKKRRSKLRMFRGGLKHTVKYNTPYHCHVWIAFNNVSDIPHLHLQVRLPNISNHSCLSARPVGPVKSSSRPYNEEVTSFRYERSLKLGGV